MFCRQPNTKLVAALGFSCCCREVSAASVTLTADDASGQSSFNSATYPRWSNTAAPSAGNDYYVGGTAVGTLIRTPALTGSYAFGGGSLTIGSASKAGTLAYLGISSGNTITVSNLILDNGTYQNNYAGATTLAGNVTLSSGGGTFRGNGGASALTVSSIISGSGALTINAQTGITATTTLTGANTFNGTTTVSTVNTTLALGNNLALQNSALDTSGAGVVNVSGFTTPTLGGLTGSKNLASVITTGYSSVTALTLNPGTGFTNSYSGNITNGASGMTLTKSGSGTQTLSGTNSYNGTTTVTAGTLIVSGGGLTLTAGLTVATTSVLELGASNVLNNAATMTLSGGTFQTGGFSDTVGALTLSNSTVSSLDFGSITSVLLFSGITSNSGTLHITNWTLGSDSLRFTSNTNLLASSFTVNGGAAAILDNHSVTGYYEVVPEPATWALLAFSLTTVMVLRRRRRE